MLCDHYVGQSQLVHAHSVHVHVVDQRRGDTQMADRCGDLPAT